MSSKVRRVMLISRGGALDGAERQLCYLAEDLDRTRFEPVVVLDAECPVAEHLRSGGTEVHVRALHPWRSLRGVVMRYVDALALTRLAKDRGVTLLHASDLWKSRYALFVAERCNIPAVIHVRGPIDEHGIRKHRLADASALIPIARRYEDDLVRLGLPPERIQLIDDAVDLERFQPDTPGREEFRTRYGVGDRVAVGLVGRVEPFKRVLEFLEMVAVARRSATERAAYFVIGQDGPEAYMQQVREAVTRLGLQEEVRFTGRLDNMPQVLAGLDILATLSGGSVMFEAMACGKTVLSVRQDNRPSEHTRHNETAWFVPAREAGPASDELLRLLGDAELRARLGRGAVEWVKDHLSHKLMIERTQAVYERLLAS